MFAKYSLEKYDIISEIYSYLPPEDLQSFLTVDKRSYEMISQIVQTRLLKHMELETKDYLQLISFNLIDTKNKENIPTGKKITSLNLLSYPRIRISMLKKYLSNNCSNITELYLNIPSRMVMREDLTFREEKLSKLTEIFSGLKTAKIANDPGIHTYSDSSFKPFFYEINKLKLINGVFEVTCNEKMEIENSMITNQILDGMFFYNNNRSIIFLPSQCLDIKKFEKIFSLEKCKNIESIVFCSSHYNPVKVIEILKTSAPNLKNFDFVYVGEGISEKEDIFKYLTDNPKNLSQLENLSFWYYGRQIVDDERSNEWNDHSNINIKILMQNVQNLSLARKTLTISFIRNREMFHHDDVKEVFSKYSEFNFIGKYADYKDSIFKNSKKIE